MTLQIKFFSCNRNPKERELHISKLDYLCLTTKPHCCYNWRQCQIQQITSGCISCLWLVKGYSSPKLHSGTSQLQELVVIELGIPKATSLDVDHIVVITGPLTSKSALDSSRQSDQSESIAQLLRLFNRNSYNTKQNSGIKPDGPCQSRW